MKINETFKIHIYPIMALILLCGCKKAVNEPPDQEFSLAGAWEYTFQTGFVDTLDPEHTYLPTIYLNRDSTFMEIARFVEWPSRTAHGFKYVKDGSYVTRADTIIFITLRQVYLPYSDTLQLQPIPVTITPTYTEWRFKLKPDSLGLANVIAANDSFLIWYRRILPLEWHPGRRDN